jgi:asparagine synthase (glutamine-hydrolysing)
MAAETALVELLVVSDDACALDDGRPLDWSTAVLNPERILGGWVAAWRDETRRLHLARDPLGTRSMYWGRRADGEVVFGTRLHDVLRAGVRGPLNPAALVSYLSCAYVPGEATLVQGISAVPPGVELVFDGAGPPRRRVFDTLPASPATFGDEASLRPELRDTLSRTVERMLPDTPLAAFLSGGIDSSLVVALAQRSRPVHALSIAFGPPHRDEVEWSTLVARHCGATHEVVIVSPEDVRRLFDPTVAALSEPNGDPLTVPNWMLFEAAARLERRVVLNGEGGDPCFGGPKNAPLLLSEIYGAAFAPEEHDVRERAYLRAHQKLWDDLDAALEPALRAPEVRDEVVSWVRPWLEDARWPSFLDRLMALNVVWKGAGHILPKVEHLGEVHGVRARSPLFDRDVVRLAFRVPPDLKRNGSVEKHLLKASVDDLLPASVLERPKSGMMVPVEAWFQGPLEAFARERLLDGLAPRGIVRRVWLERLLDRRLGGLRPRRGVKIWLLLTLESWLRQVYDAR